MTLGFQQNNPTDLKKGTAWEGVIDSPNAFAAFSSMSYGIRAWLMDLHVKIARGLNTYEKYFAVFAPSSDNPGDYLSNILIQIGANSSDSIAIDKDSLVKLFKAVAHNEISPDDANITDDEINQGFSLFNDSVQGFVMDIVSTASTTAGSVWLPILGGILLLLCGSLYFIPKKQK